MPSIGPYFSHGVAPWMNERPYVGEDQQDRATAIGFPLGGNIIVKWLNDGSLADNDNRHFRGSVNNVPRYGLMIHIHGQWGNVSIEHIPFLVAHAGPIPAQNYDFPTRDSLTTVNCRPDVNPIGTIARIADGTYWISVANSTGAGTTYRWVRIIPRVDEGLVTVYANLNPPDPNVPPSGILATKYSITVSQDDLNYWANTFGYGGQSLPNLEPSTYYTICLTNNSLHENVGHDGVFYVQPSGYREYDEIPDRTELNSRVAGEKALYEDEFLTASQVEAGTNVTLRWRNIDGSLTGYTTDPTKGGNLVIEATGGGGATRHQGRTYGPPAVLYYDETTGIIRFQDEPQDYPDSMVAIPKTTLPIYFDLFHDVANDVGIVRARAANNNLHFSVTQLNTVNKYPMYDAGTFNDYTVNHIRLVDTPNLTWNVFGDTMPTLLPPGNTTGIRQGVIITPQLNGLYVNWSIRSGNHAYFTQRSNPQQVISNDPNQPLPDAQMSFFPVDSLDGVDFWGKNGVVCTLIGAESNRLQLIIDRKLTIENTSGQAPPNDTTYIRFDNNIGNGTLNTGGGILGSLGLSDPDVNINYIGFSDIGPFTQRVPALQVTFSVHDGLDTQGFNFNNAGAKTVRGFYPRQVGRFASQWSKDFDVLDTYRTISNTQPILEVGFWGWDDGERNILSSNAMYGTFPDSVYVQRVPPNLIGNPDGLALSINFEEGLYYIDATVQGIMGMKQTTPPNQPFNPIISQALHLHLYARPQSNGNNFPDVLTNKVLQSLDVMKNYTVVPYIANQPGQDTHTWYRQANASRPWSMQGGGLFWLRGLEHISTLLTLNAGGYNNDFYYQVCYAKMSCIKVANVADIHTYPKKIDIDTDPTMYNYAPQRWHDMIFF